MKQDNLLIVGAGQYGAVAKETAAVTGRFERIDFLDDNHPDAIGKIADAEHFFGEYNQAFVAIGNPDVRLTLLKRLKEIGFALATLVSPKAYVSPSAKIGSGTIVEPCAAVQANTRIGSGCILSAGSVVNHNCEIGAGCHIDCNATVCARSVVAEKTKVNCGQVFKQEG